MRTSQHEACESCQQYLPGRGDHRAEGLKAAQSRTRCGSPHPNPAPSDERSPSARFPDQQTEGVSPRALPCRRPLVCLSWVTHLCALAEFGSAKDFPKSRCQLGARGKTGTFAGRRRSSPEPAEVAETGGPRLG